MARNKNEYKTLKSTEIFKFNFFRFRCDELELPDKRVQPRYYVMEFTDWVNVVALTTDRRLVLVNQYRHAVEEICLEIPGGSINPGSGETPEEAARRELIEETGYVPQEMKLLGSQEPNPALQNNRMWTFLALGCEKKKEQELDAYEDIEVLIKTREETLNLVKEGKIKHSLVLAGLFLGLDYLK
jgi:8-oxo-dGTP pyrophosphatase MutT (NUDIX family)